MCVSRTTCGRPHEQEAGSGRRGRSARGRRDAWCDRRRRQRHRRNLFEPGGAQRNRRRLRRRLIRGRRDAQVRAGIAGMLAEAQAVAQDLPDLGRKLRQLGLERQAVSAAPGGDTEPGLRHRSGMRQRQAQLGEPAQKGQHQQYTRWPQAAGFQGIGPASDKARMSHRRAGRPASTARLYSTAIRLQISRRLETHRAGVAPITSAQRPCFLDRAPSKPRLPSGVFNAVTDGLPARG